MSRRRGPQTPTKKHLARLEREQRQQRIIIFGAIAVVVLVVGLIVYGYLQANVLQPRQAVAEVNGTKITVQQFIERTRFERNNLVQQAVSNYQTLQFLGDQQSDLTSSILNNINQINFQLDPTSFGRQVLNQMVDEVLIQSEAENRGIVITDQELEEEIQSQFGYFPDGPPPTATSFPTPLATSTLSAQQLELVTPVPTATEFPTATPDPNATATEIPSITPTLAPTLTPTPYTAEAFQQTYQDTMQQFEEQLNISEATIREVIRAQLYRQKLVDEFAKDVPLTEEQVWARHILVADEETAQSILDQLNSGADWNELAAQNSTDTSNAERGGDLGWFTTGVMVPEFERVAFNLDIGEISEPVQTQFGWHIIQVLGKEERTLSQGQYQQAAQQAFQTWLDSTREAADIQTFDVWTQVVPQEPTIPAEILQAIGG